MRKISTLGIILVITFLIFAGLPTNVCAAVTTEWVARYNSTANLNDYAHDMTVDSSGNIYVTGASRPNLGSAPDFYTVAYDVDGNELWVSNYNGPANSIDEALCIAVDPVGNVYASGNSYSIVGWPDIDYAVVKYDSSGNEQWAKRYDGGVNEEDYNSALAVDSTGNVYITGSSTGATTLRDYATIKYDTAGNVLWVTRYNGPSNGNEYAIDVAVDETSGNVYVIGNSNNLDGNMDIVTVAYNSVGGLLWVNSYNGPGDHQDSATGVVIDSSGNIYVTGSSYGGDAKDYDYVTIAYDASGSELWVKRYDGPVHRQDSPYSITLDSSENVVVTGTSYGSGTNLDYATIAYSPSNGHELWAARYNGALSLADYAVDIAADPLGNVYVTGSTTTGGLGDYRDLATVAYDSAGNELNVAIYNGPSNNDIDKAQAIAVDPFGAVIVTGSTPGIVSLQDYTTIKYLGLTDTTLGAMGGLISTVTEMDIDQRLENSLISKIDNSRASLSREHDGAAVNQLGALINAVEAQAGKKLTEAQAEELIAAAESIITGIEEG